MNSSSKAIIFALATIAILLVFNHFSNMLLWDETVYLSNARMHAGGSNFSEDFRYPLIEWVIGGIWKITGENVLIAKLFIILCAGFSVGLAYLIAKEYLPEIESIVLAAVFMLSPLMIYWGYRVYTDVPAIFLALLSYYLIMLYERPDRDKYDRDKHHNTYQNKHKKIFLILLAGFFAGASFLARFPMALFPLAVCIYYLARKKIRPLIFFGIGALIILGPWLAYNQVSYHDMLYDFKAQYNAVERWNAYEPSSKQALNILSNVNILILIFVFIGLYFVIRDLIARKSSKARLIRNRLKLTLDERLIIAIYLVLCFIYYIFVAKLKDSRYIISFLPFLAFMAFFAFDRIKSVRRIPRLASNLFLVAVTSISILMFILSAISIQHENSCTATNPIMQSIGFFNNLNISNNPNVSNNPNNSSQSALSNISYPDNTTEFILSNAWPYYGYLLNVRARSLWDPNITYLIDIHHPKYIVYDTVLSYPMNISSNKYNVSPVKEYDSGCNAEKIIVYKIGYT